MTPPYKGKGILWRNASLKAAPVREALASCRGEPPQDSYSSMQHSAYWMELAPLGRPGHPQKHVQCRGEWGSQQSPDWPCHQKHTSNYCQCSVLHKEESTSCPGLG